MFVDSHAHIDGTEFDADREAVIQRARDAGVTAILNVVSGDPNGDSFERAIRVAESIAIFTQPSASTLTTRACLIKPSNKTFCGCNLKAHGLSPGVR